MIVNQKEQIFSYKTISIHPRISTPTTENRTDHNRNTEASSENTKKYIRKDMKEGAWGKALMFKATLRQCTPLDSIWVRIDGLTDISSFLNATLNMKNLTSPKKPLGTLFLPFRTMNLCYS